MLSGELASRTRKLEREQAQRLEKLRAREEKERLVAQRQAQRERAREEEIRQRRLVQEAAREAVRKLCTLQDFASCAYEVCLLLLSFVTTPTLRIHALGRWPTAGLSLQKNPAHAAKRVLARSAGAPAPRRGAGGQQRRVVAGFAVCCAGGRQRCDLQRHQARLGQGAPLRRLGLLCGTLYPTPCVSHTVDRYLNTIAADPATTLCDHWLGHAALKYPHKLAEQRLLSEHSGVLRRAVHTPSGPVLLAGAAAAVGGRRADAPGRAQERRAAV